MSQFHRYGHMHNVLVKLGQLVVKGQQIGTIGDGNGQYKGAAHVHYDCPNKVLKPWYAFPIGQSKAQVKADYTTPYLFVDKVKNLPTQWDHLGYDYLQFATYPNGTTYHPGCDINGKGAGSADYDQKIYSVCDGEVVYVYDGPDKNHGWGKLMVIKQIVKEAPKTAVVTPVVPMVEPVVEPPVAPELPPPIVEEPINVSIPVKDENVPVETNPTRSVWEKIIEILTNFFKK